MALPTDDLNENKLDDNAVAAQEVFCEVNHCTRDFVWSLVFFVALLLLESFLEVIYKVPL